MIDEDVGIQVGWQGYELKTRKLIPGADRGEFSNRDGVKSSGTNSRVVVSSEGTVYILWTDCT